LPFATATIQVGPHALNVYYSGDINYPSGYGHKITFTVLGTGSLVSEVNITNLPQVITIGSSASFTASVLPTSPNPTGIYQITLDGGTPTAPLLLLGPSQSLSIPASSLPLGTHVFTVFYSGDSVHSSATSAVQNVTVTPPPSFTITASPAKVSGSVLAGAPTVQLTLTPLGIFTQPVTFSCSGLPAYTACLFSPASVTFSGTAPSTDTLTFVLDTGLTANNHTKRSLPMSTSLVSLVALALLLPLRRHRRLTTTLFAVCALALLFTLNGCGTGYRSGLSGTGTFNVTVTATAAGETQTANVSLTLN
jgi:hypothetical protein